MIIGVRVNRRRIGGQVTPAAWQTCRAHGFLICLPGFVRAGDADGRPGVVVDFTPAFALEVGAIAAAAVANFDAEPEAGWAFLSFGRRYMQHLISMMITSRAIN